MPYCMLIHHWFSIDKECSLVFSPDYRFQLFFICNFRFMLLSFSCGCSYASRPESLAQSFGSREEYRPNLPLTVIFEAFKNASVKILQKPTIPLVISVFLFRKRDVE